MKVTLIYMAGPIDGVSQEDACGWREELASYAPSGVLLFNPATAYFGVSRVTAAATDHINRHVIARSSGVIAKLDGPGRAFGTIREIEFARTMDIPVVAVTENDLDSLLTHDIMQARSLEEALESILELVMEGRA